MPLGPWLDLLGRYLHFFGVTLLISQQGFMNLGLGTCNQWQNHRDAIQNIAQQLIIDLTVDLIHVDSLPGRGKQVPN
jgi:hypothetical protein